MSYTTLWFCVLAALALVVVVTPVNAVDYNYDTNQTAGGPDSIVNTYDHEGVTLQFMEWFKKST